MVTAEFKSLDVDGKLTFLNGAYASNESINDTLEAAGLTRIELTTMGIFFVDGVFRMKPVVDNGFLSSVENKEI